MSELCPRGVRCDICHDSPFLEADVTMPFRARRVANEFADDGEPTIFAGRMLHGYLAYDIVQAAHDIPDPRLRGKATS